MLLFFLLLLLVSSGAFAQSLDGSSIQIVIGPAAARAGSGRLLLFAQKVDPTAKEPVAKVGGDHPDFVVGREVNGLAAKQSVSTVLLVDDDDSLRLLLQHAIKQCGLPIKLHYVCKNQ